MGRLGITMYLAMGRLADGMARCRDGPRDGTARDRDGLLAMGRLAMGLGVAMDLAMGRLARMRLLVGSTPYLLLGLGEVKKNQAGGGAILPPILPFQS